MLLADVLGVPDAPPVEVAALAYDNRTAGQGTLFFCVPGFTRDGHDFAPDAVARGASAVRGARAPGRRGAGRAALFFGGPRSTRDGPDFAPDAVARGASALVVERPLGLGVPEVQVPSV